MSSSSQTPPATIAGIRSEPCDPLILAVKVDGTPMGGLTGRIDWRLGGLISEMVKSGSMKHDEPLLRPAHPLLPCGRLLLWRLGAATPRDMAECIRGLDGMRPGICPEDFEFTADEVRSAFGGQITVYGAPDPGP